MSRIVVFFSLFMLLIFGWISPLYSDIIEEDFTNLKYYDNKSSTLSWDKQKKVLHLPQVKTKPVADGTGEYVTIINRGNCEFGYRFTTLVDGMVTKLGRYYPRRGNLIVNLWEERGNRGILLGSGVVPDKRGWSFVDIEPVLIQKHRIYRVSVVSADDNFAVFSLSIPYTKRNIRIISGCYSPQPGYPSQEISNTNLIFGMPDIEFLYYKTNGVAQSSIYDTEGRRISYNDFKIIHELNGGRVDVSFADSANGRVFSHWTQSIQTLKRRYIRWKVDLYSPDTLRSPVVNKMIIDYKVVEPIHRAVARSVPVESKKVEKEKEEVPVETVVANIPEENIVKDLRETLNRISYLEIAGIKRRLDDLEDLRRIGTKASESSKAFLIFLILFVPFVGLSIYLFKQISHIKNESLKGQEEKEGWKKKYLELSEQQEKFSKAIEGYDEKLEREMDFHQRLEDFFEKIEARAQETSKLALEQLSQAREMMTTDTNPHTRATSVELIDAIFRDPQVAVRMLKPFLQDKDSRVRGKAARALYKHDSKIALATLRDMSENSDHWMRLSAVWALGEIGTEESVKILEGLLRDPDKYIRERVVQTINKIEKKQSE